MNADKIISEGGDDQWLFVSMAREAMTCPKRQKPESGFGVVILNRSTMQTVKGKGLTPDAAVIQAIDWHKIGQQGWG